MTLLQSGVTKSAAADAYTIDNSVRIEKGSGLSKTIAGDGNKTTPNKIPPLKFKILRNLAKSRPACRCANKTPPLKFQDLAGLVQISSRQPVRE